MIFGFSSAITGLCVLLAINSSLYWLAILSYIFTNTLAGACWVFIFSWVPILIRFNPTVITARENPDFSYAEVDKVSEAVGNEISTKGFIYSYASSVIQLIIGCGFVLFFQKSLGYYAMQIAIASTCLFQIAILLIYTIPRLKERPGPPLPPGTKGYVSYSLRSLLKSFSHAGELSELFKFLIAWVLNA